MGRFAKATKTYKRNKNYQVWQYGNHAEEIFTLKLMSDKLNYIHFNPVRAGIVEKANTIYILQHQIILPEQDSLILKLQTIRLLMYWGGMSFGNTIIMKSRILNAQSRETLRSGGIKTGYNSKHK